MARKPQEEHLPTDITTWPLCSGDRLLRLCSEDRLGAPVADPVEILLEHGHWVGLADSDPLAALLDFVQQIRGEHSGIVVVKQLTDRSDLPAKTLANRIRELVQGAGRAQLINSENLRLPRCRSAAEPGPAEIGQDCADQNQRA